MSGAYYNEFDPYPAQWLRNLIEADQIATGHVDDRSIKEVQPNDLAGYTQAHFFAGIGVWSYALRLAGWPDDRPVWTGSCPCQPFSTAGKRGGTDDPRHLWPEWFRLIRECRPPVIFGEQVASKDGLAWLDLVYADLEGEGYAVAAVDLCAAGVGAPHIRQRLYFVAHTEHPERWTQRQIDRQTHGRNGSGRSSDIGSLADADGGHPGSKGVQRSREHGQQPEGCRTDGALGDAGGAGLPLCQCTELPGANGNDEGGTAQQPGGSFWADAEWLQCRDGKARPTKPGIFPLAHGAPARVGRLRAYGNAIVAPLAAEFIRAYMEIMG